MDDCSYCHGVRLVGWSGAGPILCPTCSRGADAFTVITHAWREQRKRAIEAERERDEAKSIASNIAANWLTEAQAATSEHDVARTEAAELRAEVERLRERLHRTAHILIEKIGASGPEDADSVANRAVARIVQYRSALGFYAAADTWIYSREESEDSDIVEVDGEPQTWPGKRAREALGK